MKSKLFIFIFTLAATPLVTMAGGGEGFTPLIGIPGLDNTNSFDSYVDALYALAISIAALVAVVKIVLAGAKYMMDDIVTHKSEAKEDIKNALIGLLIIIGAVIILNTINSDLTNLSINAERAFTDQTVPDSRPNSVAQVEAQCAEIQQNGGTCASLRCELEDWDSLANLEAGSTICRQRCAFIPGSLYIESTSNLVDPYCWYDQNSLQSVIDSELEEINDRLCPAGQNCDARLCSDYYGEGDRFTLTCSGACGDIQGIYDEDTKVCVTPENILPNFAEENCPSTATSCRVELHGDYCEGLFDGELRGCESQCTNKGGVAYDPDTWACVFTNGQTEQEFRGDLNVISGTSYSLRQHPDDEAAGEPVRQIQIIGTEHVNSTVQIRYLDTNEVSQIRCSDIVPSVCVF
jgi:hypothetical protein